MHWLAHLLEKSVATSTKVKSLQILNEILEEKEILVMRIGMFGACHLYATQVRKYLRKFIFKVDSSRFELDIRLLEYDAAQLWQNGIVNKHQVIIVPEFKHTCVPDLPDDRLLFLGEDVPRFCPPNVKVFYSLNQLFGMLDAHLLEMVEHISLHKNSNHLN